MEMQRSIRKEAAFSGIGVHTGNPTTITFRPAPPNHGVVFVRRDLPGSPPIKAVLDNVVDIVRGTTIGHNDVKVHTVEHVLAALLAFGIDNLVVELDGNEPPVGDGSSLPFVEMLQEAEIEQQNAPRETFHPREIFSLCEDGVTLIVLPADALTISFTIAYDRPGLDSQYISVPITEETFVREIAPSRTFCFYHDVEHLMEAGLIRGGSLDNAVVIKDEVILSKEGLRFHNEFVRHKVLDLMGDLFLVGRPVRAHIVAVKSGHPSNIKLARLIKSKIGRPSARTPNPGNIGGTELHIEDIMRILPHRYPFLLVDRIVEYEEDKKIVGIKNVSINEPFFAGHFPGRPIMPGVLIIEAMAQVGAIMLLKKSGNDGKIAYFMTVDKCKFRRPVYPGDQLRLEAEPISIRSRVSKFRTVASVEGAVIAEAELMCSLGDL